MPIVWLSCCPGRDEKVARDVIERLDGRGEHRIVSDERMSPEQMMAIIGGARLLIGMRLHSFIYAFLTHTPVLMLSYQDKVRGMAQMAGIEEDCFPIDNFDEKCLAQKAGILLEDPVRQITRTGRFVEYMKQEQQKNREAARRLLGE